MDPKIPLDVQRLLDQSSALLSSEQQKQTKEKEKRLNIAPVAYSKTATVAQPSQIPSMPQDIEGTRGAAMEFLMADKQYSQEELFRNQEANLTQQKQSIINQSLNRFFMGNVPKIENHAFVKNPIGHMQEVLSQNSVSYNQQPQKKVQQKAQKPDVESKVDENLQITTRTLYRSVEVFKDLLQTPLTSNASIFSAALRSFQASDFLLADIIEACKQDSKEISNALQLLRQSIRQTFSDQKSGEYLQMAEIGRLRQELYHTKIKSEELRRFSIQQIFDLDQQRKTDIQNLQSTIQQVEQQRHQEVKQAMLKTKEYGEQVRTLRALVDTIKQDQQVQKMELLKNQVQEKEATIENMKQQHSSLQKDYNMLQKEYLDFQSSNSDNIQMVNSLSAQLKVLESQKDYCRNCEQKIYDKAQQISSDIIEKIARIEQVTSAAKVFDKQIIDEQTDSLLQSFVKNSHISDVDHRVFSIDLIQTSKEILVIESKLQKLPQVQKLMDDIEKRDAEINRLKSVEKDLVALRKVYKSVLSRTTDGMANGGLEMNDTPVGNEIGRDKQNPRAQVTQASFQMINENKLTLLRNQPLFMLIPKTFPIKLFPLYVDGQITSYQIQTIMSNNLNTTVEYVQAVIHLFMIQILQIGLQEPNSFTGHMTSKLRPSTGGQLLPFMEPITTIFVGWVTQQFASVQDEVKKIEAELIINKVAYILNMANSESESGQIDDETMLIALANLLFNSPVNPDEVQFMLFCYNLSYGGFKISQQAKEQPRNKVQLVDFSFSLDQLLKFSLPNLPCYARPPNGYISLRRAIAIATLVLNKAVQKGYFDKFIIQGRSTDMIKDIDISEKAKYHVIDIIDDVMNQTVQQSEINQFFSDVNLKNQELQPSASKITIIQIPFFVITLVKAYKAEVLVRIESLRIMYAASLIETSQKQQQQNVTAAQRYRIISDILTTINPLAPKPQIDSAYLDTVWRSPSGLWAVLIDACRVRGVFASGLQLPPMDCVMQVIGGYQQQNKRYDMDNIFTKLITFLRGIKPLCNFLSLFNIHEFQAFVLQIQTISSSNINRQNVLPLINMVKTVFLSLIETIFSVIQSSGDDFSSAMISEQFIRQNNNFSLIGKRRLPCEIMLEALPKLLDVVSTVIGQAMDSQDIAPLSPSKKKVKGMK